MALQAHYGLQDNAANTTLVATVGTNGTLGGGSNTADISVVGPGGSYSKALLFDGVDDVGNVTFPGSAGAISYMAWVKIPSGVTAVKILARSNNNTVLEFTSLATCNARLVGANNALSPDSSVSQDTWFHWAVIRNASDVLTLYINGVAQADTDSQAGSILSGTLLAKDALTFTKVALADVRVYDSDEAANLATIIAEASGGGGTTPKGPLSNPFMGPFGGPI